MDILVAELAREMDLPDLELDEQDYVCVQTEDGVVFNIDYFEEDDVLSFYTTVGEVHDEHRLPILAAMLAGNSAWEATGGATLCLDPEGQLALLTVAMPAGDLNLPLLRQRMQDFSEVAWTWSGRIRAITEQQSGTADETTIRPTAQA